MGESEGQVVFVMVGDLGRDLGHASGVLCQGRLVEGGEWSHIVTDVSILIEVSPRCIGSGLE